MFILQKPVYDKKPQPKSWLEVDRDEDYGALLRRNLVEGQVVGAVNFGNELTYLVFVDESILKVIYER